VRARLGDANGYFEIAAACPVLSRDEELELTRAYAATRCPRALDRLTRSMMRYVIHIATRYLRSGLAIGDLIAEGVVGVLKAVNKFEPERGLRFVTFASHWVRAEIAAAALRNQTPMTAALPRPAVRSRFRRERSRLLAQYGAGEPTMTRLADRMGVSRLELDALVTRVDLRTVSLDSTEGIDARSLMDRLVDESPSPEEVAARGRWEVDLPSIVEEALGVLDPRELFIARARLMAGPDEELSLADVGRQLRVTRERARQLEQRTKEKLKRRLSEARPSSALAA
jgi:RNA polymerase sigma-32 factor